MEKRIFQELKKGDKIEVDKGICGVDIGVVQGDFSRSVFGLCGTYKNEKGVLCVFDQAVHKIKFINNSKG